MKTKTPPTIPAPLPTDYRLLSLARLLNVTKRDALAATVEVWAWIQAQANEGVVPQPVVLLDGVAEIEGYGDAAVVVGLVGTADGHIVAPAELRQAHDERDARRADDLEERRAYERAKKRKQRSGSRLTGKTKPTTPKADSPPASTTPSREARRLGSVAGMDIIVIPKRSGGWFYKCSGATPELTGTVTDEKNLTLAAALKALLDARLTQAQRDKGKLGETVFSPTMEELVAAARREQADRAAAAAAAARLDEGNEALAQAANEDADHAEGEPPQAADDGDIQGTKRGQHGDTGTCPQNVPIGEPGERAASANENSDLHSVSCPPKCPQNVPGDAPSSSSSLICTDDETKNQDTTTTSRAADHGRDSQGDSQQPDIFSRYLAAASSRYIDAVTPPGGAPLDAETEARLQRLADALGSNPTAIRQQARRQPDVLLARLHAAGIDPKTGFPIAAAGTAEPGGHATTSPQDAPGAPQATGTGVQTVTGVQAAGGSVDAQAATTPTGRASGSRRRRERDDETARLKDAARRAIAAAG